MKKIKICGLKRSEDLDEKAIEKKLKEIKEEKEKEKKTTRNSTRR